MPFWKASQKIVFKVEQRITLIIWTAGLGSNMFDWNDATLQYFEKKDECIFFN